MVCQGELRHQARHNSAACLCHCPRSCRPFLGMARAYASNLIGLLGTLKVITFSLQDAYPLLQFGTRHFRPILKKHWSESAKHSPLSRREKRAQTSRSRRRRRNARKPLRALKRKKTSKSRRELSLSRPPTHARAQHASEERGARACGGRRRLLRGHY